MPSQKNINQLNDLKEKIEKSKAVVLADYSGLSVKEQSQLRRKIAEAKGQFSVFKNTLFKIAFKELKKEVPRQLDEALQGPTAFLFAYDDEIGPIKALVEFAQEKEMPKTKIGILLEPSDRVLTLEEIEELAKLPSQDQLLAKLVGMLNSPTARLVNALSGNIKKLAFVLSAIQKQREAN